MGFTDGGLIEPLILLVFLSCFLACGLWVTVAVVRVHAARRRQVNAPSQLLAAARDALESVISDPFVNKPTRDRAIEAREAVGDILREKSRA